MAKYLEDEDGIWAKICRLLLIGDTGVGKSSILFRYSDGKFPPTLLPTIGIDFKIKTIEIDGKRYKFQLWDTAGQERFQSIMGSYYRHATGILLVYDVTNEESFKNIYEWATNIFLNIKEPEKVIKVLVGNKADKKTDKVITREMGEQRASELGIAFIETSAKTGENIHEAFSLLIDIIMNQFSKQELDWPVHNAPVNTSPKKSCCN